jgi:hypothetical protein
MRTVGETTRLVYRVNRRVLASLRGATANARQQSKLCFPRSRKTHKNKRRCEHTESRYVYCGRSVMEQFEVDRLRNYLLRGKCAKPIKSTRPVLLSSLPRQRTANNMHPIHDELKYAIVAQNQRAQPGTADGPNARRTKGNIPSLGCMLRQRDETRPITRKCSVYGWTPFSSRTLIQLSVPHQNLNWWESPRGPL